MLISVTDMTEEEALEDVVLSLANEICDGEDLPRQQRIRKLLIEFVDEIKRSAIEP